MEGRRCIWFLSKLKTETTTIADRSLGAAANVVTTVVYVRPRSSGRRVMISCRQFLTMSTVSPAETNHDRESGFALAARA